jgi:hypothetical protein
MGRTRISEEQKQAATQAINDSALVGAVKGAPQIDLPVNTLAERFEEMCRRNGAVMDDELRPSVVKLLAAELWINHISLGAPADALRSATLHQGAVAPELLKEFPEHPAYVISEAMRGSPAASREFLSWLGKELAAVSADPEFNLLARNRPSAFAQSAIRHRSDVRADLRKAQETFKKDRWTGQEAARRPENTDKQR